MPALKIWKTTFSTSNTKAYFDFPLAVTYGRITNALGEYACWQFEKTMPFLPQFISLYVVTCTTKIISLVCLQSFWAVACLVVSRPYVRTLFSELRIRRGSWLWPPTQKSVMDLRTSLCGVVVFTYGLLHCPDFWPRKSFWYVAELSFCSSWMNRLSQTLIFVFSLCASTVQKHPQRVSWFTKMLYMGHINIIMFMRGPSHTRRKTLIKRESANRNRTD